MLFPSIFLPTWVSPVAGTLPHPKASCSQQCLPASRIEVNASAVNCIWHLLPISLEAELDSSASWTQDNMQDHHDPWMSFTANSRRLHYFMSWIHPSHKSAKPGHHVEKHSPATPRPSTTASPASKDRTDMDTVATFAAQDLFWIMMCDVQIKI